MNNNAILADNNTLLLDNNTVLLDNKAVLSDNNAVLLDNNTMLLDNKAVLSDNHTMLSDIHRNVVAGQEAEDNINQSVSETLYGAFQQQTLMISQAQVRSVVSKITGPQSYTWIVFPWENCPHHPRGPVSDATG